MKKNDKLPFFGIGKILPYMKQHKRLLWIMVGCGLAGSLMDIAIPLFQRFALNTFVVGQTLKGIGLFAAIYFVCILLAALLNYISCTLATVVEVRVLKDLRNAAFGHLQTLSFTYFNQNSVGYIHARVMSDTGRIGTLVSWRIMDCIWHGSYLIGSVIVMLVINAKLALMVLAILPLVAVLFSLFQRRLIKV
ncbi:MAG: ABC transporter ATP-binding protein, partial [Clostridia bacterium]|nr:ABC transporter ATP-binding protein [Clostridia bacterium]